MPTKKIDNTDVNKIYTQLYKINPLIFGMRNFKSQVDAVKFLLKTYSVDELETVLNWYVTEFNKSPRDKYLPIATIPTRLLEKWSLIYEKYQSKERNKPMSREDLERKYNPF